jgi:hypothetical protein
MSETGQGPSLGSGPASCPYPPTFRVEDFSETERLRCRAFSEVRTGLREVASCSKVEKIMIRFG